MSHSSGPGISSYASAPKKAGESLGACMQEAKQWVPERRHHETPLYLGATAGMRLLKYGRADKHTKHGQIQARWRDKQSVHDD